MIKILCKKKSIKKLRNSAHTYWFYIYIQRCGISFLWHSPLSILATIRTSYCIRESSIAALSFNSHVFPVCSFHSPCTLPSQRRKRLLHPRAFCMRARGCLAPSRPVIYATRFSSRLMSGYRNELLRGNLFWKNSVSLINLICSLTILLINKNCKNCTF